jgi:uncharacterized membrane protein YdjX (TVP38/TMEM64 family)
MTDASALQPGVKRRVKLALSVLSVAVVLYLAWSLWDHEALTEWLRKAPPLPFFMAMALTPLVGVPVTPFFIMAGAAFGVLLAALGSLAALGVNLWITYVIARTMRPTLASLFERMGYELPDFRAEQKGSLRFALAVKFAPGVPATAKNYALAVADIPASLYFGLSMLVTGAYGLCIVLLGDSLFAHDGGRVGVTIAVLVVLFLAAWWWKTRRVREPLPER